MIADFGLGTVDGPLRRRDAATLESTSNLTSSRPKPSTPKTISRSVARWPLATGSRDRGASSHGVWRVSGVVFGTGFVAFPQRGEGVAKTEQRPSESEKRHDAPKRVDRGHVHQEELAHGQRHERRAGGS